MIPQVDETEKKAEIIYRAISDYDYGRLITYPEFQSITGFDKVIIRENAWNVNKLLLKRNKKYIENVRNIGYKIAAPPTQLNIGNNRQIRARRQLSKGVDTITNIDLSLLSPEEKARHAHFQNHLIMKLRYLRKRNLQAVNKTKQSLQFQQEAINEIDNLMNNLQDRLKQLN